MTIARVNAPGWATGDKLSSPQANAIDLNSTYALDKRAGQSDTLGSVVSCSGAGRIVDSYLAGPDANTTLTAATAQIVQVGVLTANRTYTLSASGSVAGDTIRIVKTTGVRPLPVVNGPGSNTLITLYSPSVNTGSNPTYADFVFDGANWFVSAHDGALGATSTVFTFSDTWICPPNTIEVLLFGWGGGGGGGGGGNGVTVSPSTACGGGGGGGALRVMGRALVTPGQTYVITVGAGGSGGVATFGGNSGTDTMFSFGASTLFTAVGAQGGAFGQLASTTATYIAKGGSPSRLGLTNNPVFYSAVTDFVLGTLLASTSTLSSGGSGITQSTNAVSGLTGAASAEGQAGGTAGAAGTTSGGYTGGSGGGGGGGGCFDSVAGPGAAGGKGGNSGGAGAGIVGTAGSAAIANTGSGGGGGGGGGCGGASGGLGGAGGAGGSGLLLLIPVH